MNRTSLGPMRHIAFLAPLALAGISLEAQSIRRTAAAYEVRSEAIGALGIGRIVGAVLGADGTIIIAHDADPALLLVDRSGKAIARAGRRGRGPGEVGPGLALMRCGEEIFFQHSSGREFARFSEKLQFLGSTRVSVPPGESPYQTVCNSQKQFAHIGFPHIDTSEKLRTRTGASRIWMTDSSGAIVFTSSLESVGHFLLPSGGLPQVPLPLGRRPSVALTNTSLFVVGEDSLVVQRLSLAGVPQAPVRIAQVSRRLSPEDRERGVQDVLKLVPPMAHSALEPALSASAALVKTSPTCPLASAGNTAWVECVDERNRNGPILLFLGAGGPSWKPLSLSHDEWPLDARADAMLIVVREQRTGDEWLRVLKLRH